MNELSPVVREQKSKLLENELLGKSDADLIKKHQATMTQYNRAFQTYRFASAANTISILALLSQMAFPHSQENREKEIYCEKNPHYSPKKTGEEKVICRAVELDDHHKAVEKITPYRPDVPYRNEYVRNDRESRDLSTSSSAR